MVWCNGLQIWLIDGLFGDEHKKNLNFSLWMDDLMQ